MIAFAPKHMSHSAVSGYLRCGKAYELQKIHKFPEAPAWYLIAGTAIHTATEWWDRGEWFSSPSDAFVKAFHEEIDQARVGWPDDLQWVAAGWGHNKQRYEHWFAKGQDYLEQWASTTFPGALVDVELDVSTVLPSGLICKAYVDRLYDLGGGLYKIWDLKSGSSRPESDQQLGIYRVLVQKFLSAHVIEPQVTAANYMFKDAEAFDVDVSNWTLETVDLIGQQWLKSVAGGTFLPNRGKICSMCGVSDACFLNSGDTPVTRLYDVLNPNYGV